MPRIPLHPSSPPNKVESLVCFPLQQVAHPMYSTLPGLAPPGRQLPLTPQCLILPIVIPLSCATKGIFLLKQIHWLQTVGRVADTSTKTRSV